VYQARPCFLSSCRCFYRRVGCKGTLPSQRTMAKTSIGPPGSSASETRGRCVNRHGFSQESHLNCMLLASTNGSSRLLQHGLANVSPEHEVLWYKNFTPCRHEVTIPLNASLPRPFIPSGCSQGRPTNYDSLPLRRRGSLCSKASFKSHDFGPALTQMCPRLDPRLDH